MKTVLVVEDNLIVKETIKKILIQEGYNVIDAKNGIEGISKFKEHKPDLIITDILMPEEDGIGMLNEIRKSYSDFKVIAMSGGGQIPAHDLLDMASVSFADISLEKPISKRDLLKSVKKLLN